jgi:hypothetical protein
MRRACPISVVVLLVMLAPWEAVSRAGVVHKFILRFGLGLTSKVVMAATISFFPTLVNTIVGLAAVEEEAVLLFRSLVAHPTRLSSSSPCRAPCPTSSPASRRRSPSPSSAHSHRFRADRGAVGHRARTLPGVRAIDRKIVFWRDVDTRF